MKLFLILLSAASLGGAQQAAAYVSQQISGTVQGEDGSVIPNASLFLRRILAPDAPPKLRTDWSAETGTDGAFRIDALPYGQYRLCVQARLANWLNPCEWGSTVPVATTSPATQPVATSVMLKKGAAVMIRVDDPGQLLAQNEGSRPGAHLLLGVRSDALIFLSASVVSQDAAGRNYAVTIPFGRSVNLVVASSFFRLADATGVAVAPNGAATIPLAVATGQIPPAVHLTVSGHR